MKNRRNYAAFWDWPEKSTKEAGIMRGFLEARDALGLPRYAKVEAFKPDPPDFVARDPSGHAIAIELTELVSQEAIQANIGTSMQERVYRDWRREEAIAVLEARLADKDNKEFHGGPYDEIHVVIHIDEPILSPSEYIPFLSEISFAPCQQIARAFVLFSYDPMTEGYPLVELQLGTLNEHNESSQPV